MLKEITVAAEFFARTFRLSPSTVQSDRFLQSLTSSLQTRYDGHWHPVLHSAHRAVTIFGGVPDRVLLAALNEAGIDKKEVNKATESAPKELVVWVDPGEVAFRIGDRGQPIVLFREGQDTDKDVNLVDGGISKTSPSSSPPVSRAVRITPPNSNSTKSTTVTSATISAPLSPLGQAVMATTAQSHNPIYSSAPTYTQPPFPSFQQQPVYQQQPYQHFQSQQPLSGPFFPTHSHHRQSSFQMHFHQQQHRHQQQQQQQQQQMMATQSAGVRVHTPNTKPVVRYVEAR